MLSRENSEKDFILNFLLLSNKNIDQYEFLKRLGFLYKHIVKEPPRTLYGGYIDDDYIGFDSYYTSDISKKDILVNQHNIEINIFQGFFLPNTFPVIADDGNTEKEMDGIILLLDEEWPDYFQQYINEIERHCQNNIPIMIIYHAQSDLETKERIKELFDEYKRICSDKRQFFGPIFANPESDMQVINTALNSLSIRVITPFINAYNNFTSLRDRLNSKVVSNTPPLTFETLMPLYQKINGPLKKQINTLSQYHLRQSVYLNKMREVNKLAWLVGCWLRDNCDMSNHEQQYAAVNCFLDVMPNDPNYNEARFEAFQLAYTSYRQAIGSEAKNATQAFLDALPCRLNDQNRFNDFTPQQSFVFNLYLYSAANINNTIERIRNTTRELQSILLLYVVTRDLAKLKPIKTSRNSFRLFGDDDYVIKFIAKCKQLPEIDSDEQLLALRDLLYSIWSDLTYGNSNGYWLSLLQIDNQQQALIEATLRCVPYSFGQVLSREKTRLGL